MDVDDEGDIDHPCRSRDVSEVRYPQRVGSGSMELAVDPVERAWSGLVADCRPPKLAPDIALKGHRFHEPGNGASGGLEAYPLQLPPDFPHAMDPVVRVKHAAYLDLQADLTTSADRQAINVRALRHRFVIIGLGNRMKETISSVGGRAPPGQNKRWLCARCRWPDEAPGSRVPGPSSSRPYRWIIPLACRCRLLPS
jgi:hypothetical protein